MKMMADVYKIFKDLLSYLPNNPNKIVYTKTISEGYRNFEEYEEKAFRYHVVDSKGEVAFSGVSTFSDNAKMIFVRNFEILLDNGKCYITYSNLENSKKFTITIDEDQNVIYPKYNVIDSLTGSKINGMNLVDRIYDISSALFDDLRPIIERKLAIENQRYFRECEKKEDEKIAEEIMSHPYYKLAQALELIDSTVKYTLKANSLDSPSAKFYKSAVDNDFVKKLEDGYNRVLKEHNFELKICGTSTYHKLFDYQYESCYVIKRDGKTLLSTTFSLAYPADPTEKISRYPHRSCPHIIVPRSTNKNDLWDYVLEYGTFEEGDWIEEFSYILLPSLKTEEKVKELVR